MFFYSPCPKDLPDVLSAEGGQSGVRRTGTKRISTKSKSITPLPVRKAGFRNRGK